MLHVLLYSEDPSISRCQSMLLSGRSRVSEGDSIRLRLLYTEDETIKVDRPLRNHPLKIHLPDISLDSVFDRVGTYELTGTVEKMTYAEHQDPDYLFFRPGFEVDRISDSLVRIEVPDESEEVAPYDYTDTDLDLDVESLFDGELVETQSTGQ